MSKTMREIEDMTNLRADFDDFLRAGDEENASACIDSMGESYSELEALKMHQEFNRTFRHEPREAHEVEQEREWDRDAHTESMADVW